MLSSFLFKDEWLYAASVVVCCFIILAYGLSRIAVAYFSPAQGPGVFARAPRRPEWDEAAEELSHRLEQLMLSAAPYRDEHLALRALATRLEVEPRRLSYHLHGHLATSFRAYINEWRLRAVSQDLLSNPDRTILQIAFDNGFNSKSSFNTLFYKKYGATPREFRQRGVDGQAIRPAQAAPRIGGRPDGSDS